MARAALQLDVSVGLTLLGLVETGEFLVPCLGAEAWTWGGRGGFGNIPTRSQREAGDRGVPIASRRRNVGSHDNSITHVCVCGL